LKIHKLILVQIIQALLDIFENQYYPDKTIERVFKKHPKWGARDRRFFAENVYEIVRHRRLYEEVLKNIFKKPFSTKEEYYQILFWIHWVKIHESIPEDIELNNHWRSHLQDPEIQKNLQKIKIENPAIYQSFPDWLYDLGQQELGSVDWASWSVYLNQQAPVYLRANVLKVTVEKLQSEFQKENILLQNFNDKTPWVIELTRRQNIFSSLLFKNGFFEVQDASSQLVAPLMHLEPGMRCVDACAGAGGKSLHMATIMKNKGKIISLDLYAHKLEELQKRAKRNGIHIIETRVIESTKTIKRLSESADRVLLDVPCSGTGVLRRNPDSKWKLSTEELQRLNILQKEILRDYSKMTRIGGELVYSTCSILPSENQKQMEWFLSLDPGSWEVLDEIIIRPPTAEIPFSYYLKKGDSVPHRASDGFYAMSLRRIK